MVLGLGKSLEPPGGPQGSPRGSPRGPKWVSEEPNEIWHIGYQFFQFSALKMNSGSTHLLSFESDSHGVAYGGPWYKGPLGRSPKDIAI